MRILAPYQFSSALAQLYALRRERPGYLLAEVSIPAVALGRQALRVATLSTGGDVGMGSMIELVSLARSTRGRLVMDYEDGERTITIQIARALDSAEEAALAAEIQASARLVGGAA